MCYTIVNKTTSLPWTELKKLTLQKSASYKRILLQCINKFCEIL